MPSLRSLPVCAVLGLAFSFGLYAQSDGFVITGLETGNAAGIKRFSAVAVEQFGLRRFDFAVPPEYLKGYVHDEAIIRYVITRKEAFPARYLVICFSDAAYCRFMLFDTVVPRRLMESSEVRSAKGVFSRADVEKSIRELLERRPL